RPQGFPSGVFMNCSTHSVFRQTSFYCLILSLGLLADASFQGKCIASNPNNWNIVGGGSWTTAANWDAGHSPTTQDAAIIGALATSASTPVSITLDGNQTAYALKMDATGGRAATIDPGATSTNTLTLLSTDQTNDGIKFFTITALNGIG